LCFYSVHMYPVHYAYHVTDRLSTDIQPDWTELKTGRSRNIIIDETSGTRSSKKCLYLSTSLYKGSLPTYSPHPGKGKKGESYWRVKVPLEKFNDLRIKLYYFRGAKKKKEVLLCHSSDHKTYTDITDDQTNKYLYRDGSKNWFCNEYTCTETNYFVDIILLNDVDIRGCEWDCVPHQWAHFNRK